MLFIITHNILCIFVTQIYKGKTLYTAYPERQPSGKNLIKATFGRGMLHYMQYDSQCFHPKLAAPLKRGAVPFCSIPILPHSFALRKYVRSQKDMRNL